MMLAVKIKIALIHSSKLQQFKEKKWLKWWYEGWILEKVYDESLLNLFKKYQVPFTWNYFATSDGKGAIDGIGGEAKSIVRQQDLSKMKNVIAQNASDFAEVCKANLHRVTTHLITK